jgi:hypothetical protein
MYNSPVRDALDTNPSFLANYEQMVAGDRFAKFGPAPQVEPVEQWTVGWAPDGQPGGPRGGKRQRRNPWRPNWRSSPISTAQFHRFGLATLPRVARMSYGHVATGIRINSTR